MKAIIRNFIFVLQRFKTSSILNILGLSVAFAVFSVIIIQAYYDFSYDRNFSKADNIYLFSQLRPFDGERGVNISTPIAKEIADNFPEVKSYCLIKKQEKNFIDLNSSGNVRKLEENITLATKGILDVFQPEIISGNPLPAFTEKNKAVISEITAHKLFGNENPIGKNFILHYAKTPVTIVAVYKDFPDNCSLKNGILMLLPEDRADNYSYDGYFEVMPTDVVKLLKRLNSKEFYGEERWTSFKDPQNKLVTELTPLPRIHLQFPDKGSGNLNNTLSLLAIGILTLLIAYINFLNFSIAMAPARVRGLNIQKILGATDRTLRFFVAAEAALFSLLAFGVSLALISIFRQSIINEFFSAQLALTHNITTLSIIGLTAVILGFVFGLYPAHYITSFKPAVALSGSFTMSGRSTKLRNALIVFQFISAISLIIISAFIKIQHDYMQSYSWGIQKENIVYLPMRDLKSDSKTFCQELKKNPHIVDFTEGGFVPGGIYMGWGRDFEGQQVSVMAWPVTPTFLHFFGVKIVEGRDFSETDNDGKQKIIFNQEFLKKYKLKDIVGKQFNCMDTVGDIIGIAKDVNFESLHTAIRPMAFVMLGKEWNNWLFIKITGQDTPATIDYIKQTWGRHSNEDFNIKFLNESLDNLYKNENNLARLISIFGLVVIIIAIMGVYGLIVFNTRYKAKEIAIRKVNGSSVREIMLMLNRTVLIQMGIAYAIAVPLSYFVIHSWLKQFAYKTAIHGWVFVLAGLLVFVVTIITVSWQSYKAATTNPVEAIKRD